MTAVTVGDQEFEFGGEHVVELRESTDLLGDVEAMHGRLAADGYLFIRGFHDPELVRDARLDVLEHMAEEGHLDPEKPVEDGVIHPEWFGGEFDMSSASWTHYPHLEELTEGEAIMEFFEEFLGEKPLAYDRKLGRAKATGDFTGFHVDNVFMGRGTDDLYTVWRPIGDCPLEKGPLLICPGSHKHETLRETYAQMDVDQDAYEAFFSKDAQDVIDTIGGPLATANFQAGDALIFQPYMLHGSLNNRSDEFRISIDTRYQSVEKPVDGRWVGSPPIGHYNFMEWEETTPITELREQWAL